MKRFIIAVYMGFISLTAFSQGTLEYTLNSDYLSKWDNVSRKWGKNVASGAHFEIYCIDDTTTATKIVAYMDSSNNYTRGTIFYVYEQSYVDEDDGFSYYVYLYESNEKGTSKTHDKSEYMKIKVVTAQLMITVQLKGYNSNSYQWNIKKFDME